MSGAIKQIGASRGRGCESPVVLGLITTFAVVVVAVAVQKVHEHLNDLDTSSYVVATHTSYKRTDRAPTAAESNALQARR